MFNDSFIDEAPHTRLWKDSREKSRHYWSVWQGFTEVNMLPTKKAKKMKATFSFGASGNNLLFAKNFAAIW